MAHSKKENRDERLKAELQRTANRKVPKKAAIGAAVGLLVCIVVIAAVAIALGGSGRIASLEAGDVPALASIEGDEVALPDPIDADQVAYLRISNYPNLSFEEPGPRSPPTARSSRGHAICCRARVSSGGTDTKATGRSR